MRQFVDQCERLSLMMCLLSEVRGSSDMVVRNKALLLSVSHLRVESFPCLMECLDALSAS